VFTDALVFFERPPFERPSSFLGWPAAAARLSPIVIPQKPPASGAHGYRHAKRHGESIFHDCRKPLQNGRFCRSGWRGRAPRSPSIQRDA